ncbi:MAG: autotransporter-associated beta strand repeat-containing protein [Chthoniobacter sp.]|nr:autotransporter-associated beta strand repeat-containing protein [Chthoniobacter sp.]
MKSIFHLCHSTQILAATVAGLLAAQSARAASGTWTTNGGGLWSDTTKWSGGAVADGFGNTANFASLDLTADATVHLDSGRTLDAIMFGDTTAPLRNWAVDNNGSAANFFSFGNTTSTLGVTVNAGTATISADIGSLATAPTASGAGNVLAKDGSGKLVLSGQNFLAGDVNASLSARFTVEGGGELAIIGSLKAASSLQTNRANGVNLVGQTSANNTLTLSDSGTVVAGGLTVGGSTFGGNSVTISSPGTAAAPSWQMRDNGAQLNMGVSSSSNSLTISNGAYLRQNSGGGTNTWTIGTNAGANSNAIVVTGAGSTLDRRGAVASFINIGASGDGNSLTVSAGATLFPRRLAIGSNGGDNNSITVTGTASTAVINEGSNSAFDIGSVAGSNGNSMTISAGGSFNFTGSSSGRNFSIGKAGDNNSLTVTGSGSSSAINYTLPMGVGGNVTGSTATDGGSGNHLDVYDGGTLTSNTPLYVLGTNSVINLGNGTTIGSATVGAVLGFNAGVFLKNADGRLRFNNGRLTTGADGPLVSGAGQIALDGPAYVSTNFAGSTISTPMAGSGSLIKEGTGTLTLSGSNTYSGDTTVNLGTLSISAPYLADNADIRLASGGIFNLNTGPAVDTIRALFIDGVPQATGIWGALGSGVEHESGMITGSGRLMVTSTVPEPSAMLLLLGCGLAGLARRRR